MKTIAFILCIFMLSSFSLIQAQPSRIPADDCARPGTNFTFIEISNPTNSGEISHHPSAFCTISGSTGEGFTLIKQTPNLPRASAIWCDSDPLNLNLPFTTIFSIRFSAESTTTERADGLTFTLHKATDGYNALGGPGGRLGYFSSILTPSVAVEFDIHDNGNSSIYGDEVVSGGQNHSTLNFNGAPPTDPVPVAMLGNIEDGNWHDVRVSWDPCQMILCVEFDGVNIYCHKIDLINDIFAGDGADVIWGFTAAKGSLGSNHDICFCNLRIGEPCPDVAAYCCEGENLVRNGNFEYGDESFGSEYAPIPAGNPVNPGEYSVVNTNDLNDICSNWKAEDHSSCPPANFDNEHVLLVNGQTQQDQNQDNVIWEQEIMVDRDSLYRFCAFVKNLPQCCFDIYPSIRIEISPLGIETQFPPIDLGDANPCAWQEIATSFTATADVVTIKIYLDEMGNGDGNDLILDDISLHKISCC